MLRTCSQDLLSTTAMISVIGLSALSGCTIYTRPAPHHAAAAPAQPAVQQQQQQGVANFTGRKPATPTVVNTPTPTGTGAQTPGSAPTITAAIPFGSATPAAFRGQAYVIPTNSTKLPALEGLVPFATLFTDSFDISAQPFSAGFPGALKQSEWFAIRYEGSFAIPTEGPCLFEVLSDDGAILSVDGVQVVNNDGVHGPLMASGKTNLGRGLHKLRLDYFKSAQGTIALRAFVTVSGLPQTLLIGVRQ